MDLYGEFEWRGLVYGATDGTRELLTRHRVTGYIGFDPTAASLHVGSLLVIMALARMQRAGHAPIALVGGGTGLIGDPKPTTERALLSVEQVERNVAGIRAQLERFLDFESTVAPARLVNNADWLTKLGAVEFMRDVGKHFTVNAMLAKEAVKRRVESTEGISYTEFSYALLQAYDFLVLHDRYQCTVQMGGSDQWGNIVAGMDLIRRVRGGKAYGLVMPLITTAAGTKFGKTEGGTIWLDATLTSPYEFYQFWLNTDDRDAARYLKFFTFLAAAPIAAIERLATQEPEKRHSQRALAAEVTRLVHGEAALREAEAASAALFADRISALNLDQIRQALANVPSFTVALAIDGSPLVDLLAGAGVTRSKGEATKLIRGGGIYVNDRRITDEKERLTPQQAIEGQVFVVRKGKKEHYLIHITQG